jgi:hypothetical protein
MVLQAGSQSSSPLSSPPSLLSVCTTLERQKSRFLPVATGTDSRVEKGQGRATVIIPVILTVNGCVRQSTLDLNYATVKYV